MQYPELFVSHCKSKLDCCYKCDETGYLLLSSKSSAFRLSVFVFRNLVAFTLDNQYHRLLL